MLHFLLTITPSKPGSVWCHLYRSDPCLQEASGASKCWGPAPSSSSPLPEPCDAAPISAGCLVDLQSFWGRPRSTSPQQGRRWPGCCPLLAPHGRQASPGHGATWEQCEASWMGQARALLPAKASPQTEGLRQLKATSSSFYCPW